MSCHVCADYPDLQGECAYCRAIRRDRYRFRMASATAYFLIVVALAFLVEYAL